MTKSEGNDNSYRNNYEEGKKGEEICTANSLERKKERKKERNKERKNRKKNLNK